jgi:translocation and assembly module TamB
MRIRGGIVKAKKIVLWTAGGIVALILVVIITTVLLLQHSQSFRAYLLQRVEQGLDESTGARLTARDFKVSLGGLQLDLYGIVVHGTEPATARPLLSADHLGISIRIDSLLSRKWHLSNLTVDHPVASVLVNRAGQNYLPKPKNPSNSQTSIFDLAVRKAAIHNGEIYYNDRKTALDAALRDVELGAGFDPAQGRYYGDLRYSNALIQYGAYAPVTHNLDAKFELTAQNFKLTRLLLETGSSRFVLNASVDDYANSPRAHAAYDALVVTQDAARILKDPTLPKGDVRLTGTLDYHTQPNRPLLDTITLAGTASSGELQVATQSIHTAIRDLRARYTVDHGNAAVEELHAQLLGGSMNGRLTVSDLAGAQLGKFQAALQGVSLDQLQLLSHSRPLPQGRLSGSVNADTQGSWAKSIKNLNAHADATIQARLGQNPPTPLKGAIHADYAGARQEVALHQSYVRTTQTSINFDGKVSTNCQLQINVTSGDLHELELIAANFRPATGLQPQGLGLYGSARLNASVTGSLTNPQVRGRLEADNLRVKGSSWKFLRTDINASPSSAALQNGELQSATRGHFSFNVQAGLQRWSYTPSAPVNINLSASQLSLAELEQLAGKSYPVSGTLALNVSVHGSLLNPVGQGNITLANAVVSKEPIQNVSLNFHGNGNSITANLAARMAAGSAQGNATVDPKTRAFQFQFHADNIHLEQLQTVKERNLQVTGSLNLDATGHGTPESPELDATLAIPQLQVQKQTVRGIKLQTTVRNQTANIALDTEVAQNFIKGRGTIGIKAPYAADLTLDTGRIEFQPLVAMYSPAQAANVTGQTELHVTVRGPLQDKTQVEAHLDVPVLTAAYKQLQIGTARPIRVDYKNGTAVLQPATLQGTGTNINMQASIPVNNPNAASLTVKGTVDLRIAQLLASDLETGGQIQFDVGSRAIGGGMGGEIRIVEASVHSADVPIGMDHANGVIKVSPTRLDVGSFQAQMSGGTLTARGGMSFSPSVQFGLGLEGDNVRLRYPDGIRALMGTTLSLTGTPQASTFAGQVRIQRVSFTPDFDLNSFVSQFGGSGSAPTTAGGLMDNMRLNVAVQSTSQMNLQSSQVSISGTANLRIVGTAANPVVLGRTDLTGGELFFAGNRYVIQEGTIDFLNPVTTEPVLNLHVQTKINDYNITLALQGPLSRLRTTYTSDPALPPADIINLIARGQTVESAAAQPSQPLSLGAESLAASTVTNQIGGKIAKVAGISQLQIDPSLGADNGQTPGARVAIQQRVTSSLFVTFATDITSTQRQAIELEYQVNPRWSVTGVRDQNGGFTGQAYYKKKF